MIHTYMLFSIPYIKNYSYNETRYLKLVHYDVTVQLDGNSHVIYAQEEAAGSRLLINGRTCLLQVKIRKK